MQYITYRMLRFPDVWTQGERSGPSKEAVPSDKQAVEDNVEEEHVKENKQPETAPWAS